MAVPLKIKIRNGFIIAFVLLLVSYVLIFYVTSELNKETKHLTHSYSVINTINALKAEITDAETGARGYFITKDDRFLEPYHTGIRNVEPLFQQLKEFTANNMEYQSKIDSLEKLISRKLNIMAFGIQTFRENDMTIVPSMTVNREANKRVMDSIRLIVDQLIHEEEDIRERQRSQLQTGFATTKIIAFISMIIALLTAVFSYITYLREKRAKEKASDSAQYYSSELDENVVKLQNANNELMDLKSIEKFASSGRIARTLAHEVRNPLTNISLATEQLKEMIAQNPDMKILVEMIGRNATRIDQLVSEFLSSTRFSQLNYEATNINDLIDEALKLAIDRIELKHIKIEKQYAKDTCPIRVDKEKIKLAFVNIIVNAVEAIEKESGILQIKTSVKDDKCIVEFRDNGSGISEEALQKLFEPYYTTKTKGTGLGLTNTQNIIFNHGGSINVKSKLGEGTVFIVSLHLEKETATTKM